MKVPPPHPYYRTHPPVIEQRRDGLLCVTYQRMLLRKFVKVLLHPDDLPQFLRRVWNVNNDGILISGQHPYSIRLHRVIARATHGQRVRFANGKTLDLRRENLVVGGHCRAVGKYAPCLYPCLRWKNGERITVGIRTMVAIHGRRHYREFCFEKYGMEGAAFRALQWRVGMMRAYCMEPSQELEACLVRAKRMMAARTSDGFSAIYGGNAEYENTKVVASEIAHWADFDQEAA